MTLEELFIRSLETEMQEAGNTCTRGADSLYLPDIELEVVVHDAVVEEAGDNKATSAIFEARAASATTEGIRVFQLGYGLTASEAAREASYQWCVGVYPALRTYIATPAHHCDVDKAHMLVRDADSGEEFGWTIYLPPILSRAYGEAQLPEDLEQSVVFQALFDVIHPFAAHNHLFWLECFAVRYPKNKIDATCRFNNNDWEEGQEALLQWALSWTDPEDGIISHRQFLLFEPTPIDQLSAKENLSTAMENYLADQSATNCKWSKQ